MTTPSRTKNSTILWICGALATAMILVSVAVSVIGATSKPDVGGSASADVSRPECARTAGGNYSAKMRVTNSTDRQRDYSITVAFLRSDKSQITTGTARVADLGPGQSASPEALGIVREGELLFGCEITTVRRT